MFDVGFRISPLIAVIERPPRMPPVGAFINLDRGLDRRAAMETQFRGLEPPVSYRRFPAIEGNPFGVQSASLTEGEIGNFTSHTLLLQMHLNSAAHLHVLEDDAMMARRMPVFLDAIIASGALDAHDILFTETMVPMNAAFYRDGRRRYRQNIRRGPDGTALAVHFDIIPYIASVSSYVVNRASIRKVSELANEALAGGPNLPFDNFLNDSAQRGRLKIGCVFPFITSIQPGGFASTIAGPGRGTRSNLAVELMRHSFFVDCDMRHTLTMARERLAGDGTDLQSELHAVLGGFAMSDESLL